MPVARLLVLGGSWFLGRKVAEAALARGWEVTTFRRGQSGEDAPGVAVVRGDRTSVADLARLADAGPWDVVVDTSGYVPREVLAVARALEPVAGRYVFVSTVSVYQDWPTEPLTEDSPVLDCPPDAGPDFGYNGDPGPSVYGFTKAGSERAVSETFGADRSVSFGRKIKDPSSAATAGTVMAGGVSLAGTWCPGTWCRCARSNGDRCLGSLSRAQRGSNSPNSDH